MRQGLETLLYAKCGSYLQAFVPGVLSTWMATPPPTHEVLAGPSSFLKIQHSLHFLSAGDFHTGL